MIQPQTCPLCGEPNACAVVACGSLEAPCWCQSAVFSEELLARVPAEQQGLVCICARCAREAAGQTAPQDQR